MTVVFRSIAEWRKFRASREMAGKSLGFVPTMGALHEGHGSLFEKSVTENDRTLASIFVNPTQLNDPRDLEKYPRTFEADLDRLKLAGVHYLLYPSADEIYGDRYRFKVQENELSRVLCGAHRPGHFDGVLTVVLKLLNIASADRAYFGEKDFQQLLLVRQMCEAFFVRTEIIGCPTVREIDGLAMSSRNIRLDPQQRELAAKIPLILRGFRSAEDASKELASAGFEVDYVEDRFERRLAAVRLGEVRLIDNVIL